MGSYFIGPHLDHGNHPNMGVVAGSRNMALLAFLGERTASNPRKKRRKVSKAIILATIWLPGTIRKWSGFRDQSCLDLSEEMVPAGSSALVIATRREREHRQAGGCTLSHRLLSGLDCQTPPLLPAAPAART